MDQPVSNNQEIVVTPADHQRVIDALLAAFNRAVGEIANTGADEEK